MGPMPQAPTELFLCVCLVQDLEKQRWRGHRLCPQGVPNPVQKTGTEINDERRSTAIPAVRARVSTMLWDTEEGSRLGPFHLQLPL